MDANGNFKVDIEIADLEALRTQLRQANSEKQGLVGLIRQLKSGEISLEDLFMNGNELRYVKKDATAPEPTANVPGGSVHGNEGDAKNGVRGPAIPEQEPALAGADGSPERVT